ncbi:MAG TPA: transcriptional repressor [Syntrophobacteraceae bacterium]|nr:transcriptional repressor [Syntrophobacteraceae bacterium]
MTEGQNERDFIATLRGHGLQVTYQRLAIYQALYDNLDHPSAEVIYQQVRKRFPMISLGTVYKTLERFYEVGLVQKVSPVTEVARYDAKVDPHHHMVCLKCQSITDLDASGLSHKITLPEGHDFRVLRHQVLIQGYCSDCHKES